MKKIPKKATIGELYEPAMKITDPQKAKEYFDALVSYCMSFGTPQDEAIRIQKANLGYFAGYYGSKTRARVEKLFNCAHPVFGAISEYGEPTPEGAFDAGKKLVQKR